MIDFYLDKQFNSSTGQKHHQPERLLKKAPRNGKERCATENKVAVCGEHEEREGIAGNGKERRDGEKRGCMWRGRHHLVLISVADREPPFQEELKKLIFLIFCFSLYLFLNLLGFARSEKM